MFQGLRADTKEDQKMNGIGMHDMKSTKNQ